MVDWILGQEGLLMYCLLFLALMGGAVGLPIPEDLPLVIAGVLVQRGSADLPLAFLVCYVSILLGDLLIFAIGRRFGSALFSKPWVQKRMSPSRVRRMKLNLEKRSLLMIFLARHLFYMRTITFLTCGAVKMRVERFLLADACAALVSVPIMLAIGYFAAEHFELALKHLKKVEYVSAALGLIVIAYLIYRYKNKKNITKSIRSGATDLGR